MGTMKKPGEFDCLKKLKANPDMPYFLLLATDPLAAQSVRNWASAELKLSENPSLPPEKALRMRRKAAEAMKLAGEMEAYRIEEAALKDHAETVKGKAGASAEIGHATH